MTKETKIETSEVRLFNNDHGVQMLEISGVPRPTFISVNKAKAIIKSISNPELISEVTKYGRDLFKVKYDDGRGFTIGNGKITAVFENSKQITKLVG